MSDLFSHLRSRADSLRASKTSVAPVAISRGANRWLLASLLQKAIRRGQSDLALGAALVLLENDPPRLWRRLMTVALEDVGIGDLAVAVDLVAVSSSVTARKLLGGSQASLEILVPLACRAVKDRTADHVASLIRWERARPDGSPLSVIATSEQPKVAFSDGGANLGTWVDQVLAASALAGAWERGKLGLDQVLGYFDRQGAPQALLEACGCYARRCAEPLFVYALVGWAVWAAESPEVLALARPGLAGRDLGGLPDYCLDPLRTRLGRRAIELWLRSYLEKVPFDGRQVMAGLWNMEAALCSQTLFWDAGGEMRKAAYEADLLMHGLCVERHDAFYAWLVEESPVLFSARQMVWQSHLRALPDTGLVASVGQPVLLQTGGDPVDSATSINLKPTELCHAQT